MRSGILLEGRLLMGSQESFKMPSVSLTSLAQGYAFSSTLLSSSSLLFVLSLFFLPLSFFFFYHPLPPSPANALVPVLLDWCMYTFFISLLHFFILLYRSLRLSFYTISPYSRIHATSEQYEVVYSQLEHALLLSLFFYPLSLSLLALLSIFSWFSFGVFFPLFSLLSLFCFSHTKQASIQVNIHQASWPSNVIVRNLTQAGWFGFNPNGDFVVWYDLIILRLVCKQETRNKKQKTRNRKQETRNKKQETRNKKQETKNKKQKAKGKKQETKY